MPLLDLPMRPLTVTAITRRTDALPNTLPTRPRYLTEENGKPMPAITDSRLGRELARTAACAVGQLNAAGSNPAA